MAGGFAFAAMFFTTPWCVVICILCASSQRIMYELGWKPKQVFQSIGIDTASSDVYSALRAGLRRKEESFQSSLRHNFAALDSLRLSRANAKVVP